MDVDGQDYYVKPMNCPFHIQIYRSGLRSYRELPLRLAELGTVYRYERSGVLHGLLRVRGFHPGRWPTSSCRPDQLDEEVRAAVDFARYFLRLFGFQDYHVFLSTRPDNYVGELQQWEQAEGALRDAVMGANLPYDIDEGGGVFYGPKIDVHVKDAIGRAWQLTTIQFDFNMPQRFGLSYIGEDGREHQPYMVHRALLGSIERFFGVLLEHYAGAFPLWLAPIQALIIPIADRHNDYARSIADELGSHGFRTEVRRAAPSGCRPRFAMLSSRRCLTCSWLGTVRWRRTRVAVRLLSGQDAGPMPPADLVKRMQEEVASRQ